MDEDLNRWLGAKRRQAGFGVIMSHSYSRVSLLCQSYCADQNMLAFEQTNSLTMPCLFLNLPCKATPKLILSAVLDPSHSPGRKRVLLDYLEAEVKQRLQAMSTEIFIIVSPGHLEEPTVNYLCRLREKMGIALILAGTSELLLTVSPSMTLGRSRWDCYQVD